VIVRLGVVLLIAAAIVGQAAAATRYDPRLRFRTLSTARFDIHFHQGEDALAGRLARIAETVAVELDRTLGRADGRVQVILVDQTDVPNGWATPLPYNTIEITAAPPTGAGLLGNTDDWLRLVFTHEYTHVVHLSRAGGWIGGLRRVFGRLPVLYPNLAQPLWAIEGIATWQETSRSQGRLSAGDFRQILERGASGGRFEPLDRAGARLVDWPAGHTPYLYGGFFHEYLARRYGDESIRRLTDETARRVPYFGSPAYRKVFARSLGDLWQDFRAEVEREADRVRETATRITHHGFSVTAPRFAPDGRLFYSVANPHAFPALMELQAGAAPRRIAPRYLGNGIGFAGSRLVFDQLETVANVGLQSDLWVLDGQRRVSTRLTRHARAGDPDVSPDGTTIVCTVQQTDRRALATIGWTAAVDARVAPVVLVSEPDTEYASPRWSPDGRRIAAERRRQRTGRSEIVLIDRTTAAVRTVAAALSGRAVSPVWTSDGRALLFASDREGGAFRIYRIDLESLQVRRLEGTGPSAQSPALSPDGRTLVFVGYTPEGYDLFTKVWDSLAWSALAPELFQPPQAELPLDAGVAAVDGASQTYAPWRTLLPRFWTPTLESDRGELVAGAATGSLDALGRHAYGVEAGWSVSRARPDWQVAYAYDRWWPTLFAAVSDDTDPWRGGELRTTEIDAGALLPVRRVRWSHVTLASFNASTDTADCSGCDPPVAGRTRRRSLRGGWSLVTARAFGYSISAEEGGALTITAEATRAAFGSDGDAGAATLDVRRYLRVWPRHGAVALRAAAAASWGDEAVARAFSAAGNGRQSAGFGFGSDAIGLLRGFDESDVLGTRAAVLNADYRAPLLRIERGAGTLPFFLRTVHGAIFVDAGHAWTRRFRARDARVSAGAELSADTLIGYSLPLTFTAGAAWRVDGLRDERGFVAFGRLGRAF
jgi:dipeptidyl aminopeptidase/acylaminoacyl peptidase